MVSTAVAHADPDHVAGVHVNMPVATPVAGEGGLDEEAARALAAYEEHRRWGTGYSKQQSTRPQTLGYGLVDSPAASAPGSSRSSGPGPTATATPRTPSPATRCSTT